MWREIGGGYQRSEIGKDSSRVRGPMLSTTLVPVYTYVANKRPFEDVTLLYCRLWVSRGLGIDVLHGLERDLPSLITLRRRCSRSVGHLNHSTYNFISMSLS